ncbi:unnamed protein product, partial [Rotaria sordida]
MNVFCKETLRLQPTAPIFALESIEDNITLSDGYEIHKNDMIVVLLSQLHRDPKVWDRPEEFLPERMLNDGFENLPSNSWKPFSNGQRGCNGRPFAWQESLLAIALILKHFNIDFVDPSYDLRIKQTLTIKPEEQQTDRNHLRPMSILCGSNSGSCESFAETLASEAPLYGYNATVATLHSAVRSLPNDRPIIIIIALYEGKSCENAKQFVAYLESKPKL